LRDDARHRRFDRIVVQHAPSHEAAPSTSRATLNLRKYRANDYSRLQLSANVAPA